MRASNSNDLNGINSVWDYSFKENLIWRIRNGESIKLWEDHLIPGFPNLKVLALRELLEDNLREQRLLPMPLIKLLELDIGWEPPEDNYLKLNTKESFSMTTGLRD
ncbi:hypothetical protein PIB30_061996 [Stylosanthes scabra]|uniref:Uncharacterized protein n=1 Tax=Stylosanthes scabra TaxID=79078 RepID=A0ABU6XKU5_9FABA|nr:hypothetical protein [Stylosanthes scabra]